LYLLSIFCVISRFSNTIMELYLFWHCVFGNFNKGQFNINAWVYFWQSLSILFLWSICIFYTIVVLFKKIIALWYILKSGNFIHPA
jgi:hypothetical protein